MDTQTWKWLLHTVISWLFLAGIIYRYGWHELIVVTASMFLIILAKDFGIIERR